MKSNEKLKPGRKQKGRYQHGLNTPILNSYFSYEGNYAVYGLTTVAEPNIIHYVGQTKTELNRRYGNHLSDADADGTPKERWVWSIKSNDQTMVLVLLEEGILTHDEACEREQYYVQKFRDEQHPLKNVTRGGKGTPGRTVSEETKLKTSIAKKGTRLGVVMTEETKLKISASLKNRYNKAA